MEWLARVADAGRAIAKGDEVGYCLGDSISKHTKDNLSSVLAIDLDVEVDFLGHGVEGFTEDKVGCAEQEGTQNSHN